MKYATKILCILLVCSLVLLPGCIKKEHVSVCTLYISKLSLEEKGSITSEDLILGPHIYEQLQNTIASDFVQNHVQEQYPGIEYTWELEQMEDTCIFHLFVSSNSKENVHEICNLIAHDLCQRSSFLRIANVTIIDSAKTPK